MSPALGDQDGDSYDPPLDCNDANGSIHPGAAETCNGFDDDCDGSLDEGCSTDCTDPDLKGDLKRITDDSATSKEVSIAWTGNGFGISWQDNRDGNYEIYFALLDPSGHQSGNDLRITQDSSYQYEPSLTWTGTEFGIAWEDYRHSNYEIYFVRLDASGSKIGSDVRITENSNISRYPAVTWGDSGYGVAWQERRDGNYETYFALLDATGTKTGSDIRVSAAAGNSRYPEIVWDGIGYGIVWQDDRDGNYEIYFSQLDAAGTEIVDDVRLTNATGNSEVPVINWTGNEYGVAWEDYRDVNGEIYFTRVSSSGVEIGDDTRITNDEGASDVPSMAWSGSEFGLVWRESRDDNTEIYFARVSSSGSPIGSDLRITYDQGSSYLPDIVRTGSEYGMSWSDDREGNREIYFRLLGCDCIDGDGDLYTSCNDCDDSSENVHPGAIDICNSVDDDCDGTVDGDTDGDGYLPCVDDCDNGNPFIYPGDTEICNGADDDCDGTNDYVPDNDYDGYHYCSNDCNDSNADVYSGATEVCNALDDDCDGTLDDGCDTTCDDKEKVGLDNRLTEDFYASKNPAMALAGDDFGIAWQDDRDGNLEIYFALLNSAGNRVTSDLRITADPSISQNASIAWTGNEFGLAWEEYRDSNYEIYFVRLDEEGDMIGSERRVTADPSNSQNPSLVWTGNGYSLTWNDGRDGNDEIYFARLDKTGQKIGEDIKVTSNSSPSVNPSLVWSGSGYGIAWEDLYDFHDVIYLVRLDLDGSRIGSDIKVNDADNSSQKPFMVWADDRYAIVWRDNRDSGYWQIYFAQYDSTGSKIGSDSNITDNLTLAQADDPSIAWSGGEYGVTWTDNRNGNYEIYFQRVDTSGNQVESNFRLTNDPNASAASFIIWEGAEFDIVWEDYRFTNYEIFFVRLGCNCVDGDGDEYNSCQDCDDDNADIYPDAPESCNFIDDDCDGYIDENFDVDEDGWTTCGGDCNDNDGGAFQVPSVVEGIWLQYAVDTEVYWTSQSQTAGSGTVYDVIGGQLSALKADGGYASSYCQEDGDDVPIAPWTDYGTNPPAGDGYYYLLRAENSCGAGTYGDSSLDPDPRDGLDSSSPCTTLP